uniref:Uncharacterized protein n=1 Tax=Romanomermis culicivorax TaxID=13658 RepID=A0A915IHS2_ROMCU
MVKNVKFSHPVGKEERSGTLYVQQLNKSSINSNLDSDQENRPDIQRFRKSFIELSVKLRQIEQNNYQMPDEV